MNLRSMQASQKTQRQFCVFEFRVLLADGEVLGVGDAGGGDGDVACVEDFGLGGGLFGGGEHGGWWW
ncbi:hypothetical protein GLAREA_05627 [Glarea lozoyensis ATCC 20868]|uniref:Uncharacterized protein n=1 Tax=Glarea lozoyensis (strain ATCC 20868 / MF5171) TaxID=1116229 RepID=S3DGP7_GLAL2|nr:uncharacterized protein GLAREA_05627 [Glarea lozoyensis ATCC 20868]EPE36289.1 hypothetical protein GLAREA_05627 [Glarea lozoyensis ATCC 20868]